MDDLNCSVRPWYMHALARMGQKAKCLCGTERVQELGEGLRLVELDVSECGAIIDELERMLREDAGEYEQPSITYLKQLKEQIEPKPWYMVTLERMAKCARSGGPQQSLLEDGADLRYSAMSEEDWQSIIWELARMVRAEGDMYSHHDIAYFNALQQQIEQEHS